MCVRVARIGKPFGVKGLVTVQLFTDAPEQRLAVGLSLIHILDGVPDELRVCARSGDTNLPNSRNSEAKELPAPL